MTDMVSTTCLVLKASQQVLDGVCTLVARTNPAYKSTAPLARLLSDAIQRSIHLQGMVDE
jgi:hypothetical protein